ncbi:MAG: FAD-binding protein [Candidatus Gastranaerophilales bacterium]|nr:FAD-binding protein [Candidatus Gastranaerophilales bacterium]
MTLNHKKFLQELKHIAPHNFLSKKEDLYVYAHDTSQNPEKMILPLAVVFPRNKKEVSDIVKVASKYHVSIVARAQGTNHCGSTRPIENSIIVHFSFMNKIIQINKTNLTAIVEPNVVIGDLNKELDKYGLFFPPDPSNLAVSTIGGAIGLCSGGPRTFKYGNTKDYIINLEVVLSNGEIIETAKDLSKNVTGYNLTSLFVGSEGTLGLITKATLKLLPKTQTRLLTLAYFDTLQEAGKCSNEIINKGLIPSTIDLIDKITLQTIEKFNPCNFLVDKEAMLLIELDGFLENVNNEKKILKEILLKNNAKNITQTKNEQENEEIWRARRSAFSALTQLKPNVITEDIVVPRDKIVDTINKIAQLSKKYNIITATMGHIADGNIHPNFALDLKYEKDNFEKLKDELFYYALSINGTLSGEHGIGTHKQKYLKNAIEKNAYNLMKEIKKLLDPKDIFNTGKSL